MGYGITHKGIKSFIVEKRINGKPKRITLGRYGALTVEQARKEAQKALGKIVTGINPIAEKQHAKLRGMTLKEVFEDYLNTRKSLKPSTRYNYETVINTGFAVLKDKPFTSITKDKVVAHHTYLGENHGEDYANLAMRILRALFNFAIEKYEDTQGKSLITENLVKRLSKTRAWYRTKKRKTYIKPHQLNAWYQAVMLLENELIRDYLLTVLLTGLRRNEVAQLEKNRIDLTAKILFIGDPKNHEAHILPLSDYLCDILKRRIEASPNQYIFPSSGKRGHLVEPRKQVDKVVEKSEVQFTVHDLRRTFITIAESLDIPAYALKRLLNHKMKNDVTAGYIITDVERLRKPMQQINDFIIAKCFEKQQESKDQSLTLTIQKVNTAGSNNVI